MARPKKEVKEFVLPTNPTDLQTIRDAIYEIEGYLTRIEDHKTSIKDSYTFLDEKYQMPKELIAKMVKAHQDDKYDEMVENNNKFEIAYEKVMTLEATMDLEDSNPDAE